jgi:hypothetical protein
MKTTRALLASVACVALWGCSAGGQSFDREEMLVRASALTKVARAVASAVQFKDAPANISEDELLRFATQHDPEMLEPFRDYAIRARRAGMASSVLMCTRDRRTGLIEDSGCSAASDANLWDRTPPAPCEFQLNLDQVCPK